MKDALQSFFPRVRHTEVNSQLVLNARETVKRELCVHAGGVALTLGRMGQ